MTFATTPVSSDIAAAIAATVADVAPVAKPVRVTAIPYSQDQSFKAWTAKDAESKGAALWSHILPLLSAFLISGGSSVDLKGTDKKGNAAGSPLAQCIHTGKTRRDRAARAAFLGCLETYSPRACEYDADAHSEALSVLESMFLDVLIPAPVERVEQAKRYTLAQVLELAQTGNMPSTDGAAIFAALSAVYGAKQDVAAPITA